MSFATVRNIGRSTRADRPSIRSSACHTPPGRIHLGGFLSSSARCPGGLEVVAGEHNGPLLIEKGSWWVHGKLNHELNGRRIPLQGLTLKVVIEDRAACLQKA